MKIHPRISEIHRTLIYQYLIVDQGRLILIDAGLRGNHIKILRTVKGLGYSNEDLGQILITHSDADHYGSVNSLREATKAQVCAGVIENQAMIIGKSSRPLTPRGFEKILYWFTRRIFSASPTSIDLILQLGDVLPILGGLEVLDTQGHTPGHLSFISKSEGILFAGDSIDLLSGNPKPSKGANTWNEVKAQQAFDFQLALKPNLICAGHGYIKL
jgi:glyoxylase-like metal-dependent hydrolase (beta-lactamase superfamily II)